MVSFISKMARAEPGSRVAADHILVTEGETLGAPHWGPTGTVDGRPRPFRRLHPPQLSPGRGWGTGLLRHRLAQPLHLILFEMAAEGDLAAPAIGMGNHGQGRFLPATSMGPSRWSGASKWRYESKAKREMARTRTTTRADETALHMNPVVRVLS